jgi:hypothetical protein
MSVIHTVRETGELRPDPTGDFDGLTRRDALTQLLRAHQEECKSDEERGEPRPPIARRVMLVLGLTFQLAVATRATVTIESSGPKLTPAAAVAVLRSSHSDRDLTNYVAPVEDDGPRVYVTPCVECDIQQAIANAEAWRRAGFVVGVGHGFVGVGHGFYARDPVWTIRTSPRGAGPSNRVQTGRANGRRR